MKKTCLSAFLLLFALSPIFAQHSVTGTVRDEKGDPLPFASVWVDGSVQGSVADADGKYSISVLNDNAVLVYSSLGYYDKKVKVNGRSVIDVQFDKLDSATHGKINRRFYNPGSADRILSSSIELLPATSPLNILNGVIPGVRLTSPSGQPGSSASISIRGVGFEHGGNPLIVIDGIVYEGVLSSIPLSDIESISVFKDAASTTIYGAAAANGVILITTNHPGPSNTPRISAKVAHGFVSRQQKDYEVMDLKGYMESLWRQAYNNYTLSDRSREESALMASAIVVRNLGYNDDYYPWKGSVGINDVVGLDGKYNPDAVMLWGDDTDWTGATQRIGQVREYGVSASGSSWSKLGHTEYFGSVSYLNNQGYMTGTGFERYSARANVSFTKKWLSLGVNSAASLSDMSGNLSTSEGSWENPFYTVLSIPPTYTIHLHRADGSFITDDSGNRKYDFGEGYLYDDAYIAPREGFAFNVAAYQEKRYSHYRRAIIDVHPYLKVSLPGDLELTANASVYNSNYTNHTAVPYYEDYLRSRTSVTITHSQTRFWTTNQLLSWKHTFGYEHGLDLLLGHETRNYTYDYETTSKQDQIIYGDNYQLNNYTTISTPPSGESTDSGLDSWFARVKYNYNYLLELTGSFRRDADTVQSDYHDDCWSVGAALNLTDFDLTPFDFGRTRLRASVGGIRHHFALPEGASKQEDSFKPGPGWDVAFEFEGSGRSLYGSIGYFSRPTSDMMPLIQPESIAHLFRTLVNKGWEMNLSGMLIDSRYVRWRLGANATVINNRIKKLPVDPYTTNGGLYRVEEGHPVYSLWLYQWKGVDPSSGLNYYELGEFYFKPDGTYIDGIADNPDVVTVDGGYYTTSYYSAKRDYSGSPIPKVFGGLSSGLQIGRFALTVNLYYQLGGRGYDSGYASLMYGGLAANQVANRHVDAAKSWTAENPGGEFALLTTSGRWLGSSTYMENVSARQSTRWLTSTNMLEINNATLSYSFPDKWCETIGAENLELFVSADHLCLLNARRGYYSNYSFSNYTANFSVYKPARTIMAGINLTL